MVALAVPADPTSAVTMEGTGIAGRLVAEASRRVVVVRLVAEVAVRVQTGLEADGRTTMEDLTLVAPVVPAEGAQEALEAEVALVVREEDETPLMRVMTTGEGVVASAPT